MDVTRTGGAGADVADDPESADAAPLDLAPRDVAPRRARAGRKWPALVLLVVIVGAIGWVLIAGLSEATTFFYNVDEAVAKKAQIGDRSVRLQGNVVPQSQSSQSDGVRFVLAYHGQSVRVLHRGEVPDLFQPAIPVIVEGHFRGDTFESDKILVRHDNTYDEKNSDRVAEACRDAQKTASQGQSSQGQSSQPASAECTKVLGGATPASP